MVGEDAGGADLRLTHRELVGRVEEGDIVDEALQDVVGSGAGVDVGAALDELEEGIGVAAGGGVEQRGLLPGAGGVDGGAAREEEPDGVGPVVLRGDAEGGVVGVPAGAGAGAGAVVEEDRDRGGV